MLEQIRHDRFWIGTRFQIQHDSQVMLVIRFVVGIKQLWQLPRINDRSDLCSKWTRFDSVRNRVNYDPVFAASLFAFVHHPFAANLDRASPFFVDGSQVFAICYDSTAERKIRSFDLLEKIFGFRLGIFD